MPMPPLRGAIFVVLTVLAGGLLGAEVVTLTPVADTAIWELDPNFNFGRDRSLPAGAIGNMFPANGERARVLYKFDVAGAVPAGATVEAVRLTLRRTGNVPPSRGVSDFALARVLVEWGEGNNRGEGPGGQEANDPGEATWIDRMHPSTGWSAPGGVFGVDFASEQSALVGDVDTGSTYIMHFNATGVADVQAMADGAVPNYGWVLYALDEVTFRTARHFTSREAVEVGGTPPALEITYSVVAPPAPRIIEVEIDETAQELVVRVAALEGYRYQLESGDDLSTWTPGEIQDAAGDGELIFRVPMAGPVLFVRVDASVLPPPG